MIVAMKKAFLIVLDKEKKAALRKLGKLGVFHVNTVPGESTELNELLEQKQKIEKVLLLLQEGAGDEKKQSPNDEHVAASVPTEDVRVWEELDHLLTMDEQKRQAFEELEKMKRENKQAAVWGEFDPADIQLLGEKNIFIRLYQISKDEYNTIEKTENCFVISQTKSLVRLAYVSRDESDVLDFPSTMLPKHPLSEVEERIKNIGHDIKNIDETIKHKQYVGPALEQALSEVEEKIEFETAHLSMGVSDQIAYLKGFVPEDTVDKLKDIAVTNSWGLLLEDPADEDEVPTLVKNPKCIRIIQPIFDLIGTVPGYREYDISFFFLIFFSIFFAMIIGDAGYGTILFIGALIGIIKGAASKKGVSTATALLAVLSLTTMVWGAITGTWFGSAEIAGLPFFRSLIINRIATFNPRSSEVVKLICFIMGTIQICIAHMWNFISGLKKKPKIKALSELGWFVMVLGLYYLVLSLVLNTGDIERFAILNKLLKPIEMPQYSLYMILAGVALVILFGKQEGKFLKGIAKGFGGFLTTFLDGIGAFSDIISYIRLFAVGLATVEIAKSFNAMAAGTGSGVTGIIGGALILILGHTLNLAMGALSVIVHGVRLNMLEFSGHLGMEWTGRPYSPLRERSSGSENNV